MKFWRRRRRERLRRARLKKLIERADAVIYEKKLFLKPDFSRRDLAVELSTNRTYIAEALANCRHCNWREYVSSFRLRYFTELACLPQNRHVKIEDLAAKCGFGAATTLNRYLKKEFGITASVYRKNLSTSLRAEGSANTATLS